MAPASQSQRSRGEQRLGLLERRLRLEPREDLARCSQGRRCLGRSAERHQAAPLPEQRLRLLVDARRSRASERRRRRSRPPPPRSPRAPRSPAPVRRRWRDARSAAAARRLPANLSARARSPAARAIRTASGRSQASQNPPCRAEPPQRGTGGSARGPGLPVPCEPPPRRCCRRQPGGRFARGPLCSSHSSELRGLLRTPPLHEDQRPGASHHARGSRSPGRARLEQRVHRRRLHRGPCPSLPSPETPKRSPPRSSASKSTAPRRRATSRPSAQTASDAWKPS